jgi:ribonuclease-3
VEDQRADAGALPEPGMRPDGVAAHRVLELRSVRRQAGSVRLSPPGLVHTVSDTPEPADQRELAESLGVEIDAELLRRALTHRSYAYEHGGLPHNERLEFLGDAVLGIVITDTLYRDHPDLSEGKLAKLRASVVNMRALAGIARGIAGKGLGGYIRLGRGEESTGGRDKASILADTLEALFGAIYLERGLEVASRVIHDLFDGLLDDVATIGAGLDWKTSLQELTAERGLGVPEYAMSASGPDHEKTFTAQALVAGELFAASTGSSKKEAEQLAAETAWRAITARDVFAD